MRTPIAYALGFPERIDAGVDFLDLARIGALHFEAPDLARFPCLRLAYEALRGGRDARPPRSTPRTKSRSRASWRATLGFTADSAR